MGKKMDQEPKYYSSPINNPVLNYRVYYLSITEKIIINIVLIVVGGLVGLVFYGGLFKEYGENTIATTISNAVIFIVIGLVTRKLFLPQVIGMLKKGEPMRLRRNLGIYYRLCLRLYQEE